jgi:hypothetical protein
LHYNYGAAAIKLWGKETQVLQDNAKYPRPPPPEPAEMGPSKTTHNRTVDSEGQALWDEDDVMLFFWGNSKAAKERHCKKLEESTRHMEEWREGVAQDSV